MGIPLPIRKDLMGYLLRLDEGWRGPGERVIPLLPLVDGKLQQNFRTREFSRRTLLGAQLLRLYDHGGDVPLPVHYPRGGLPLDAARGKSCG